MSTPLVYVNNDNDFVITGFELESGTTPITDASFTAAIYDRFGALVANASGIVLTSQGGGKYIGTIPSTGAGAVALQAGVEYLAIISCSNYGYERRIKFTPQYREA